MYLRARRHDRSTCAPPQCAMVRRAKKDDRGDRKTRSEERSQRQEPSDGGGQIRPSDKTSSTGQRREGVAGRWGEKEGRRV